MQNTLQNILDLFGLPEAPKTQIIPKEIVMRWMASNDIEVLGALYAFLMDSEYSKRIEPSLTLHEYTEFVSHYFERCFRENPDGDWSHSRYAAAWDFASWFKVLWEDPEIDRKELCFLKKWLANIYYDADETLKHCIVTGTLEHLLENREIARFFLDWKKNILLADAYIKATQWSTQNQ